MTSSYKTCYRRNAALQHAHSKQSTSLESRYCSSTRSIDSDVQKLQKQLMGYKVRQSQCSPSPTSSNCSSPIGANNQLSDRVKQLSGGGGGGDMAHSAPDITLLFSDSPPKSPLVQARQRTSSGSRICTSPLLLGPEPDTAMLGRRGSLDSRGTDRRKVRSGQQDLRRMVQESPLLSRRRVTSPDTMLSPCSSPLLNNRLGSLSPLGTNGDKEERNSAVSSPCSNLDECRRHSKSQLSRKRSKSLDDAIKTVDDITKFFDKLRGSELVKKDEVRCHGNQSPRHPGNMSPETEDVTKKSVTLPEIDSKYKLNCAHDQITAVPALVVTEVVDEEG